MGTFHSLLFRPLKNDTCWLVGFWVTSSVVLYDGRPSLFQVGHEATVICDTLSNWMVVNAFDISMTDFTSYLHIRHRRYAVCSPTSLFVQSASKIYELNHWINYYWRFWSFSGGSCFFSRKKLIWSYQAVVNCTTKLQSSFFVFSPSRLFKDVQWLW